MKFIRIHKDAWERYIEPWQHSKWKEYFEMEKFIKKDDAVGRIGIKELIKQKLIQHFQLWLS